MRLRPGIQNPPRLPGIVDHTFMHLMQVIVQRQQNPPGIPRRRQPSCRAVEIGRRDFNGYSSYGHPFYVTTA